MNRLVWAPKRAPELRPISQSWKLCVTSVDVKAMSSALVRLGLISNVYCHQLHQLEMPEVERIALMVELTILEVPGWSCPSG